MSSGWGDDFQVFLQRVRLMRPASSGGIALAPAQVAGAVFDTVGEQSMEMSVDDEDGEQAKNLEQQLELKESPRNDSVYHQPGGGAVVAGGMVKVTVGIDEDLRLILEMDPSIVDLGGQWTQALDRAGPSRVLGLPPISGG